MGVVDLPNPGCVLLANELLESVMDFIRGFDQVAFMGLMFRQV
jgi:hypothetical protein